MINTSLIRNFSIIAHIDHGKSTLCDRLLELTGQIKSGQTVERVLDNNPISRQRGITIKLAPVRMKFKHQEKEYLLNMIDTPGHVDFHYEVSRSLAAGEGAILVVDASQGIQAQTLSYWQKAKAQNLKLIGVINKIDLPTAQTEEVKKSMMEHFGFSPEDIVCLSAKNGQGVDKLLIKIITDIPPPKPADKRQLQALVFDSFYHAFKGVVVYVRVMGGTININNLANLKFVASNTIFKGLEIGVFQPKLTQIKKLAEGEVGYIATGLKNISLARVGDTLTDSQFSAPALPGYQDPQPVVFFNFFPVDVNQFANFKDGLKKLKLNDASFVFSPVFSEALGKGYRCGFLGLLHAEIVQERLEREFNLDLVATQPSVVYQVERHGQKQFIYSASQLSPGKNNVLEPVVKATIFTPSQYLGNIFKLCEGKRGVFVNMDHFGLQVKLTYAMPLSEIIVDFFDRLKAISSGFASFDYQSLTYRSLSAVRLDILIHGQFISALSQIVPQEYAYQVGKELVKKLKKVTPKQMFSFAIQAAIGGKVIASEKLSAYRKDVTAKLYGGDQTRKDKLLKKQAKGKKRLKQIGKIELSQEAFLAVLKRS